MTNDEWLRLVGAKRRSVRDRSETRPRQRADVADSPTPCRVGAYEYTPPVRAPLARRAARGHAQKKILLLTTYY